MKFKIKLVAASFTFILAAVALLGVAPTAKAYDGMDCGGNCGSVTNKKVVVPYANVVDVPNIVNIQKIHVPYNVYVPRMIVNRLPDVVIAPTNECAGTSLDTSSYGGSRMSSYGNVAADSDNSSDDSSDNDSASTSDNN